MNSFKNEKGYLELLQDVINNGENKNTRNGNVISSFGKSIYFYNINIEFPLLTTKKMFLKGIIEELLWFLRGSTNAKELQKKGVKIWDGNSSREYLDSIGLTNYDEGELGPVYGWQWRNFGKSYPPNNENTDDNGFDQIKYVIEELLKSENSRRAVLSAWNPSQLSQMALPPCHILYSFYKNSKGLYCSMSMRSSDLFLGLPFNIASTAIFTFIIAKVLHINPYGICLNLTDAHIYEEHINAVNQQLENMINTPPSFEITKEAPPIESSVEEKINWITSLTFDDFVLHNYESAGTIKAPMK